MTLHRKVGANARNVAQSNKLNINLIWAKGGTNILIFLLLTAKVSVEARESAARISSFEQLVRELQQVSWHIHACVGRLGYDEDHEDDYYQRYWPA